MKNLMMTDDIWRAPSDTECSNGLWLGELKMISTLHWYKNVQEQLFSVFLYIIFFFIKNDENNYIWNSMKSCDWNLFKYNHVMYHVMYISMIKCTINTNIIYIDVEWFFFFTNLKWVSLYLVIIFFSSKRWLNLTFNTGIYSIWFLTVVIFHTV